MAAPQRHRIVRPDGKQIYLVPKKGHLLVCARGCCCGRTDRGNPPVPIDFYKAEYTGRKLRKHVQLTMSGCIGPCPMLNAVQLVFDGRPIWFQSINSPAQIVEIYNYIERMLAADGYLPPPSALAEYVFNYYRWNHGNEVQGLPSGLKSNESALRSGFLFATHADTDLQSLQRATIDLPPDFPPVRGFSLNGVAGDEQMQALLAAHGGGAQITVVRVLGNLENIPGFNRLVESAQKRGQALIVLDGASGVNPQAAAASTVSAGVLHEVAAYLQAGGPENLGQCLRFLSDHCLLTAHGYDPPVELPEHGIYRPGAARALSLDEWRSQRDPAKPTLGVLFYRAHWMSGNLEFIDSLVREIEHRGANALPVFTTSLKQASGRRPVDGCARPWPAAFDFMIDPARGDPLIDVLIATTSHAIAGIDDQPRADQAPSNQAPSNQAPSRQTRSCFDVLGVPVLQAIASGAACWQWEVSSRGLNPLDTAMNVALPEFDGRIITVPISFKERLPRAGNASFDSTRYAPIADRLSRVAGLAMRLARLRRLKNSEKRVAVVLTNNAGKAGRIGNAVGLDAPASLIKLLAAMRAAGYSIDRLPANGDALIHEIIDLCSYDELFLSDEQLARAAGHVSAEQYERWFHELPQRQRERMEQQWGPPPGEAYLHDGALALAGLDLGNVFIGLQPPRGFGMDPNAIYHQPDLPPPHHYFAFYRWLQEEWRANAVVHLGKHGTLEWLPGKGIGLSSDCVPDSFLGDLPLIYPFIVNDPGEGSQAKRRGHAVVVDHLVPPMTTADAYGPLAELTRLVDEYYQVESLDPSKLPILQQQIWELIKEGHLDEDLKHVMTSDHGHTHDWDEGTTEEGTPLSLASMQGTEVAHVIEELDAYLCELTGAQIRNGLHVLGELPAGEGLIGLLHAMTQVANLHCPSLASAIAGLFELDLNALLDNRGGRLAAVPEGLARSDRLALSDGLARPDGPLVTHGDALEAVDEVGKRLLAAFQQRAFDLGSIDEVLRQAVPHWDDRSVRRPQAAAAVSAVLHFIGGTLYPALLRTTDEIDHLLRALDGCHIPAGPSGAPTRGMAHVLPTGRNFYAVDPRALPSRAAWQVGQALAREVLQRHLQEAGAYPETVGISVWGTSAMRTHGDDVAQIFALLGVRPQWQLESRRLLGVELIPLEELQRPRIDVVVRISGFFRDAFPHLIRLIDEAVRMAAQADEPPEQNFLRKHFLAEVEPAVAAGECEHDAERRAQFRIFGCKPGSYGAGILPLIDERNWRDHADLAEAYIQWGGYAYTAEEQGFDVRDVFRERLRGVQVALHNQDNREHDIFDSDDYLQFHGGMIAAVRALTGRKPRHYFGDTHDPSRPAVRDLKVEVLRVFRTRVANPKWLNSIQQHGYKGGLELSATVDYLFGFDATADVVDDWMYQQVAEAYVLDPQMRHFLARSNPWAMRAMAERLIEAQQRGLWSDAPHETLEALHQTLLATETLLESRSESQAEGVRV